MTLRTRLALSHFFVIGLFIVIFISIVVSINGGFGPAPHTARQRGQILEAVKEASTVEELKTKLSSLTPEDVELSLWSPQGQHQTLSSPLKARSHQSFSETLLFQQGELEGSTLEVRTFRPDPKRGSWLNPLRDILLAASLAGMACIAISVALSRFISRPVAHLAQAVESFEGNPLTERLEGSGPPEIKDLAQAFNEMADRLSANIEELRWQKEQAELSEKSRRQFLGEVSHNLRTPLAAILGWTDTLLDGLAPGQEVSYLRRVRRETRYVATTIERLLDLSRWERARPMLRVEPFALAEALLETAENLEEAATEKGIELILNLPETPCWVAADRHRVRDLFQILLENVVEHAGDGVRVEISVKLIGERYQVTVTDNGVGLPEQIRIGWKGDAIVAATGRASLGLAIARHLAEAHQGELLLGPGPSGVGTQATFSLPRGAC